MAGRVVWLEIVVVGGGEGLVRGKEEAQVGPTWCTEAHGHTAANGGGRRPGQQRRAWRQKWVARLESLVTW